MDNRKIGDNYYVRMHRGDEIISTLLEICKKESIPSAVFSGIGGCQSAELQVFIPETGMSRVCSYFYNIRTFEKI